MQRCAALQAAAPFVPARGRRARLHARCEALPAVSTTAAPPAASNSASTSSSSSSAATAAVATPAPAPAAPTKPQLRLRFGTKNIPHPNKAHYGGEDAFFVSEAGSGAAGIADGVGGWQEAGINPADYSKQFMATARQYLEECATVLPPVMSTGEWLAEQGAEAAEAAEAPATKAAESAPAASSSSSSSSTESTSSIDPPTPRTAVEALDTAHRSTQLPGSATACVLRLDGVRRQLDAANLGDSGFLIIRGGQLVFQSPAMQHFFDCPLQFGMPPDTDWAEDAAVFSLDVQPGDAIVLATDGLLDNLYPEDIVRLAPGSEAEVEQAASAMAELASKNAADPDFESPYTQEALEEGIDLPIWEKLMGASFKNGKFELGKLRGGKMDDITVVVAYVTEG